MDYFIQVWSETFLTLGRSPAEFNYDGDSSSEEEVEEMPYVTREGKVLMGAIPGRYRVTIAHTCNDTVMLLELFTDYPH